METRPFWQNQIENAWKQRNLVWLSGVRRAGKTMLCQSLKDIEYFDCELPSVRRQLEDPETFFKNKAGSRIALDEIHRLKNPSEILKIATDHFKKTKVVATGSSTLAASHKFGDTLTGRKSEIWLTPLLNEECKLFANTDIEHRFLHGGLPPYFIAKNIQQEWYTEWLDSYWARDIQALFRLGKRYSFQKFVELIFMQSGEIYDATRFTAPCEASRPTINNYLSVLESTYVAHIIRPFNSHRSNEITSAPKVYAFDTGFICHAKGWDTLRTDDMGLLWEHLVLNEMHGRLQTRHIHYWRNKQKNEIDFVYIKNRRHQQPIAIECKWKAEKFNPKNLHIFRKTYPNGKNYVIANNVIEPYTLKHDNLDVHYVNLEALIEQL